MHTLEYIGLCTHIKLHRFVYSHWSTQVCVKKLDSIVLCAHISYTGLCAQVCVQKLHFTGVCTLIGLYRVVYNHQTQVCVQILDFWLHLLHSTAQVCVNTLDSTDLCKAINSLESTGVFSHISLHRLCTHTKLHRFVCTH